MRHRRQSRCQSRLALGQSPSDSLRRIGRRMPPTLGKLPGIQKPLRFAHPGVRCTPSSEFGTLLAKLRDSTSKSGRNVPE
jgi:hypothetical protein